MRLAPRIIIPASLFMLLIGYQNFSVPTRQELQVPAQEEWDSQTTLQVIHDMQEFQKNDPGLPQELAVPQGGSDLESVRNNWVERQGKILLNGFDKKIENAVNDKINAFVESFMSREPAKEKPTVEGSSDLASTQSGKKPLEAPTPISNNIAGQISSNETQPKTRHVLKFPRPNMIKYEVGADASVNLIANPGATLVNYSQAYNDRTRLGVEHDATAGKTQMFFRYDW